MGTPVACVDGRRNDIGMAQDPQHEARTGASMKTVTINTYQFSELSEEAQATALDSCRDWNVSDEWWDYLFDDAKAVAALLGIDVSDIYFSGFASQGDGASVAGSYAYAPGWRKALSVYAPQDAELMAIGESLQTAQRPAFYTASSSIVHRGHYQHSGCMDVVTYWDAGTVDEDDIRDTLRLFADWLYTRLEAEYDYLTGDEAVRESLEANEVSFTEDGKRV